MVLVDDKKCGTHGSSADEIKWRPIALQMPGPALRVRFCRHFWVQIWPSYFEKIRFVTLKMPLS
jgi:hypothetical protein